MADPAMCYQEIASDYTVQRRKRKGPAMYLKADFSIDDVEPSNIMALFLLFFPKDNFQSRNQWELFYFMILGTDSANPDNIQREILWTMFSSAPVEKYVQRLFCFCFFLFSLQHI
jgi:hypothetical protein